MLLGRMLSEACQQAPQTIALWFGPRKWSYAELDQATDRIAGGLLAAGVHSGDRLALFLPNSPELMLTYFACFKIGAITVPLNYRYRKAEVEYSVGHSKATSLVVHPSLVQEVDDSALGHLGMRRFYLTGTGPVRPGFAPFDDLSAGPAGKLPGPAFDEQQPAAILYTSGTTAKPKGVTYSHGSLWHNCVIQCATFEFGAADVHLVSTAACHAAAFTGQLLPNVLARGTSVLTHLPTPEQVVQATRAHGVTRAQMLPASLEDLVEYLENHTEANLKSWRCCLAGGDVVPVDLHTRFRNLTGFDITELCGMTEALSYVTNPPFGTKRLGSIGKPSAQTKMRLVDDHDHDVPVGKEGEILVQTPAQMIYYWNDPQATAATVRDGWLHTGDLGRMDEDGYYWFVGRKKEIIIRGGSNISPLEIEEILDEHPAVHLSCVVGKPDAHLGETVAAYVALRPDVEPRPTAEELRQFVAERLAAYKVPETITIMAELPLNSTGKVDRKKLHAQVRAEAAKG